MAYQTSQPNNIDFMYQMPENLMLQAINTADSVIDKQNDQADMFDKYVNSIPALEGDKQRLNEVASNYRNQIENVRSNIQNDPANYRKQQPMLRSISRGLMNDNDLKTIQNRYSTITDWQKTNDQAAMKGEIDPILYERSKSQIPSLIQSTGYDPNTKTYGNLTLPTIGAKIDYTKRIDEYVKDMQPIKKGGRVQMDASGNWLYKTKNGLEYLSPDMLKKTIIEGVGSDAELQHSVSQYNSMFGNEYGNKLLNNAIQSGINRHTILKEPDVDMEVNPWAKTYFEANQKVDSDKLKRMHDLQDQVHDDHNTIAQLAGTYSAYANSADPTEKAKAVEAQQTARYMGVNLGEVNKTVKQSKVNNNQPIITQSSTNKVAGITNAINPNGEVNFNYFNGSNKLTPSLVYGKIQSTQQMVDQLTKDLNNIPDDGSHTDERAKYQDEIRNQKDLLANNQNIYSQSKADVMTELKKKGYSDNDIELARKPSTINQLNNQIGQINNQIETNKQYNQPYIQLYDSIKQLENTKKKYENIADEYNSQQTKWFDNNSSKTSDKIKYTGISGNESTNLGNIVASKSKQIELLDPATGESMNSKTMKVFDKNAQGTPFSNLTYSFDTDNAKSLGSYLKSQGKTFNDAFQVVGISKPIPGVGTTLTVKPKMTISGLDNAGTYLLKVPSDVATSYAQTMKPKNDDERQVQKLTLDREKNSFITDASKAFENNTINPVSGVGIPTQLTIKTPIVHDSTTNIIQGGKNITLKITPKMISGQKKYAVEGSVDGGNTFTKPNGFPEYFNTLEEIADNMYKSKQSTQNLK